MQLGPYPKIILAWQTAHQHGSKVQPWLRSLPISLGYTLSPSAFVTLPLPICLCFAPPPHQPRLHPFPISLGYAPSPHQFKLCSLSKSLGLTSSFQFLAEPGAVILCYIRALFLNARCQPLGVRRFLASRLEPQPSGLCLTPVPCAWPSQVTHALVFFRTLPCT